MLTLLLECNGTARMHRTPKSLCACNAWLVIGKTEDAQTPKAFKMGRVSFHVPPSRLPISHPVRRGLKPSEHTLLPVYNTPTLPLWKHEEP